MICDGQFKSKMTKLKRFAEFSSSFIILCDFCTSLTLLVNFGLKVQQRAANSCKLKDIVTCYMVIAVRKTLTESSRSPCLPTTIDTVTSSDIDFNHFPVG